MEQHGQQDSPLSTTSSVAGLLTFVVAIAAAVYARLTYLRNSDAEYFRVKTSLSWFKTESAWLGELLATFDKPYPNGGGSPGRQVEYQMHKYVMDDLLKLEQRLLDLVADVEVVASPRASNIGDVGHWTLVPETLRTGRASVGVAWMSVRTKAMELVRQREALTGRVQFLQMSMMSSRLGELEARLKWGEAKMDESSRKIDGLVELEKGGFRRMETLVQQMASRSPQTSRWDSFGTYSSQDDNNDTAP